MRQRKTGVDILTNIEKLLQKEVLKTKFCKVISKVIIGLRNVPALHC